MDSALLLSFDMLFVLIILSVSIILFATSWVAADLAALIVLVMLGLSGLVPLNQLFSGFASDAVIAIMAVMILGAGLDRTGVMNRAADLVLRFSGNTERGLILALCVLAGGISGFMQNPAVVALFLPVASRLSARTGFPLSRFLLPMACCIVLGGTMTTVGNSPMIMLNDLIGSANRNLPQGAQTLSALSVFSVFPIGISLLISGLAYFYFFGLRMLPSNDDAQAVTPRTTESYFEKLYGQTGVLTELRIYPDSLAAQKTIGELEAMPNAPLFLAIKTSADSTDGAETQRSSESRLAPPADEILHAGTVLAALATPETIEQFAASMNLGILPGHHHLGALFDPGTAGVSEAVLPPTSSFVGKTAFELRLRRRYGMNLLAVHRAGQVLRDNPRALALQSGDTLIFHSSWADLADHAEERQFVVITDYPKEEQRTQKQGYAIMFFVGAFLLALVGKVALPIALLAGSVGMLCMSILSMDEAYRAINWKTIFSLACLLPLSVAMEQTGTAAWIAQELTRGTIGWPHWLLQTLVALLSTFAALFMSQVGATVLMVPMAINIGLAVNGNPTEFALLAALGASNNFFTAGNPVIAMITGPGNYSRQDYLRVGLPLVALVLVVSLVAVNLMF